MGYLGKIHSWGIAGERAGLSFHHAILPHHVPFEEQSFSGILCSEVFHFLDHAEVIATVWDLHRLLVKGGKAIITCACEDVPILQSMKVKEENTHRRTHSPHKIQPLYNIIERMEVALKSYGASGDELKEAIQFYRDILPKSYFNYFNPDQLAMVFERTGFEIESIATGPAPQYPIWDHSERDQVRLVAKKK